MEIDADGDGNLDGQSDTYEWSNLYLRGEESGVRPVIGLMWNALERLSVGATLSQIQVFDYSRRTQTTFKGVAVDYDGSVLDFAVSGQGGKPEYPLMLALGVGWFPSNVLLVSGDVAYYGAVDAREAVVNVAAGAEYYLDPRWALRAGLFSDFANTPHSRPGWRGRPARRCVRRQPEPYPLRRQFVAYLGRHL